MLSNYICISSIACEFSCGINIVRSYKTELNFHVFIDEEHYLKIYNEQLERKETLKVNIIQCMTIGPPTVGKTTLKEQLLKRNKRNKKKSANRTAQPRPPSSPVIEKVKTIQVTMGDKKSGGSDLVYATDDSTWKTRTLDEQLVACLKKFPNEYLTSAEIIFWILFLILICGVLYDYSTATLPKFNDKPRIIYFVINEEKHRIVEYEYAIKERHKLFQLVRFVNIISMGFSWLPLMGMVSILTMKRIYPYLAKLVSSKTVTADIAIKEALKKKNVKKIQPVFDRSFTVYFRDCGGQPEFHEVLPALSSQSTLFFLVFNLSEGLDTQYKVTYKTSNGKVSDPYMSSFTVKQALLHCLASISAIGSYCKPHTSNFWFKLKLLIMQLHEKITQLWKKKLKRNISNVIIIGTHKDKVGKNGEVHTIIDQLENELIHTDWYTKDMVIPTESGRLVLGVNTFNRNDIKEVKKLVNKLATNNDYQLEIPVPWLTFEFYIQKSNKKVMTLKECQSIAEKSNITLGNEFDTALWFLHNKVGTIRYFKNVPELQNIVITDPQLLFDIVTDLIVNTFSFGKYIQKRSEHDRFRLSGRFTKHHLEHCEAVKEKLLSVEQVIAVLEHLVIIAPVGINEQEYFLPCILVHASLPSTPLSHNDSDIPPLLITFKCHYTPRGIFSSLIARILLDNKDKWELSSEKIFRNQVRLRFVKSGHLVTITNFFRFLEIAVKPPHGFRTTSSSDNIHVSIQCLLSHYLIEVRNQLNYACTADHLFGFYCKEHNDNNTIESHIAVCNDNKKPTYTKCYREEPTVHLTPLQMMWFNKNCKLNIVHVIIYTFVNLVTIIVQYIIL